MGRSPRKTIGIAGGLNLYGYANGDPINLSDPFGLCLPKDDTPCPLAFGGFTGSLVFGVGIDVAFGFTVDETDGVGVYGSIGLRGV